MPGTFPYAVLLFLQLTAILITCRIVGRLLRYLGQTQVVSEMIAGVLLGPSLFGAFFPQMQAALFPKTLPETGQIHPSMIVLYVLSQIGLVLYMFLIGLHLDVRLLSKNSKEAWTVSASGVLTPMLMGGVLGVFLAKDTRLFQSGILTWEAALFVASAMSITAFPMLARILTESGFIRSRIGTLAIGAAAFDDAAAWCLLACVLASFQNSIRIAALAIGGGALYALVMIGIGRRVFRWFERITEREDGVRAETVATLVTLLMFCAWLTDVVGIYSIFGAFIAGLCMPRGRFQQEILRLFEPLTVSLLLPIFFVYSGLNTKMSVLVEPGLFGMMLLTVLVAFVCKGGGCLLASRVVGANWRDAAGLGVLMNARGLMELILVNIALEKRLITTELFTILVVMAIVTTLAASPLFHALYRNGRQPEGMPAPDESLAPMPARS
jgi:Kef-type K+ transport system membrane component KefB